MGTDDDDSSSWQATCSTLLTQLKKRQSRTVDFFNRLKKNKKGHVTRSTFQTAVAKEDGISKEEGLILFNHIDSDKDGQISLADFNAVCKIVTRDMSLASHSASKDSSPRVSRNTSLDTVTPAYAQQDVLNEEYLNNSASINDKKRGTPFNTLENVGVETDDNDLVADSQHDAQHDGKQYLKEHKKHDTSVADASVDSQHDVLVGIDVSKLDVDNSIPLSPFLPQDSAHHDKLISRAVAIAVSQARKDMTAEVAAAREEEAAEAVAAIQALEDACREKDKKIAELVELEHTMIELRESLEYAETQLSLSQQAQTRAHEHQKEALEAAMAGQHELQETLDQVHAELDEKRTLTVTLTDTQHRLEAQLAAEKHESERYQLESQALRKKLEAMEERGRRKGGHHGEKASSEASHGAIEEGAPSAHEEGTTSSYAEIMSSDSKRHKRHGHHMAERSPSIDPISRMVAQLPERERTAHLASELVAASDRVKESHAKIAKLEEEAKKREREMANLKASKTETERRLIALETKTPGAKKSRGPSQSPKLDQMRSGTSRDIVASPTNSLQSFGDNHDVIEEQDSAEGDEAHISAAELTHLRTALTVAKEEAERLKDELAEALEDAALLKQLNDMDQLTIGSLTSGNHPHHVEANKQQLLQRKESMIEQESLNKKNMEINQELIIVKRELAEAYQKNEEILSTSKREHEEVTKLKLEAEEKIQIFEKILLNENQAREILENEIKDYSLELQSVKSQLQYQLERNKELVSSIPSVKPPRAPSISAQQSSLIGVDKRKSLKEESYWQSELDHHNAQLYLIETEITNQVSAFGGGSAEGVPGSHSPRVSPRSSKEDVSKSASGSVHHFARQVVAKQGMKLISECGVSGHMITCNLDEAASYAYAREVVPLSKDIHIIEDHLIPCFDTIDSISQIPSVQASGGALVLLDEIKRQIGSSGVSSNIGNSDGFASSPVRRASPTMTPPASPSPYNSSPHASPVSSSTRSPSSLIGKGENGVLSLDEVAYIMSLSGELKDVVAHDMSLFMLKSLTKQCKLISQKGLSRCASLTTQNKSTASSKEWFVEVALIKVLGQRFSSISQGLRSGDSNVYINEATQSNILSRGYMELLLTCSSTKKQLAPTVKLPLPSDTFGSSPSMIRFTCCDDRIQRSLLSGGSNEVVLTCKLFLQNDTEQDESLGCFDIQLKQSNSARIDPTDGGEDGINSIDWMQQWCGTVGTSQPSLALMRTRIIPSVELGLKSELKLCSSRLNCLKKEYLKIYYPVSKKFSNKSIAAMKRQLKQQHSRLNARYSTPLEWWRYDISENDRNIYGMGFAIGFFLLILLAFVLDSHNPIAQKCKAVLLLLQAALLWECCNYCMSTPAQEALKEWFAVDQKFVVVGATVTKIGVTGAIFHAVLLFLGTNSSSGSFSVEFVTPLLWVWFLGIMTGHLVFGRMASSEVVDYLKVDMDEARARIAAVEEKEAMDLLSYQAENNMSEDMLEGSNVTDEEDNFEDGNVTQDTHANFMDNSTVNQSYSIE